LNAKLTSCDGNGSHPRLERGVRTPRVWIAGSSPVS